MTDLETLTTFLRAMTPDEQHMLAHLMAATELLPVTAAGVLRVTDAAVVQCPVAFRERCVTAGLLAYHPRMYLDDDTGVLTTAPGLRPTLTGWTAWRLSQDEAETETLARLVATLNAGGSPTIPADMIVYWPAGVPQNFQTIPPDYCWTSWHGADGRPCLALVPR